MAKFEEKQESSITLACGNCSKPIVDTLGRENSACVCHSQNDIQLKASNELLPVGAEESAPITTTTTEPSTYKIKVPDRSLSKDEKEAWRSSQRVLLERILAIVIFFQVSPWLIMYIVTPGYVGPFLHNIAALISILALFAWEAFGIFLHLHFRTRSEFLSTLKWLILITFFIVPSCLAPWLGPAVLTIVSATGAIVR